MDTVLYNLSNIEWTYGDQDDNAFRQIAEKVAQSCRQRKILTYSELVSGIIFKLKTVNHGNPFSIGEGEWSILDRAIVGSFLGKLSLETYKRGGFFGSALVVSKETKMPSAGFWELISKVGINLQNEDQKLTFWSDQVNKAFVWFKLNDW